MSKQPVVTPSATQVPPTGPFSPQSRSNTNQNITSSSAVINIEPDINYVSVEDDRLQQWSDFNEKYGGSDAIMMPNAPSMPSYRIQLQRQYAAAEKRRHETSSEPEFVRVVSMPVETEMGDETEVPEMTGAITEDTTQARTPRFRQPTTKRHIKGLKGEPFDWTKVMNEKTITIPIAQFLDVSPAARADLARALKLEEDPNRKPRARKPKAASQ
jgi:hypothetical protein